MSHNIKPSQTTTKRILITPNFSLNEAKEITFLTREYYDALRKDLPLPSQPLPELRIMLLANTIVTQYMEHVNFGLTIKLFNACLQPDKVAAVWMFANEPTLNIQLGKHQLFVVKHPNCRN